MLLPHWAKEVISSYESGAAGCFVLHGNISDRMVIDVPRGKEIGGLSQFMMDVMLPRFDVVITYDLGYGMRIERGSDTFYKWPTFKELGDLPRDPLPAISFITHYLTYCRNLRISGIHPPKVAVIVKQVHLVCPHVPNVLNDVLNAIATFLRSWAENDRLQQSGQAAFLISENLNGIHNLVTNCPRICEVEVPLPPVQEISDMLEIMQSENPIALGGFKDFAYPASRLTGATLSSIESLVLRSNHEEKALDDQRLTQMKKELVERDCSGLIDFVEPDRSLGDVIGLDGVKQWLRQDIDLWQQGELEALPMGYLLCGPVGTGKTYLAECLAGEAGVPVITMRNFRDKWVGSTEANLEKIFALMHALGRCIIFVDEADQALGKRQSGSGDSGVSSRVYSMMAKEMSNTRNRGKVIWVLASSRPDLIEVDLKRPGRIDVKIPLFPTLREDESFSLIKALGERRGIELYDSMFSEVESTLPTLLTPGAAEAIAVKTYRIWKTSDLDQLESLKQCLASYRPPVSLDVLKFQMRIAAAEATDSSMVPTEVHSIIAED